MGIASLLEKNNNQNWIVETKKWSIVSWTFLTAGIALDLIGHTMNLGGVVGGWDCRKYFIEALVVGLALVHSLIMIRGEQAIERWIVFLSILCFSLSVLGTFLVGSGILTSVHSFASDASRVFLFY